MRAHRHSAEITIANETVFIGKVRQSMDLRKQLISPRQRRLLRICRCLKYLHKVCVDIQSLFAPRFLSFSHREIVYILPLRWNAGETFQTVLLDVSGEHKYLWTGPGGRSICHSRKKPAVGREIKFTISASFLLRSPSWYHSIWTFAGTLLVTLMVWLYRWQCQSVSGFILIYQLVNKWNRMNEIVGLLSLCFPCATMRINS